MLRPLPGAGAAILGNAELAEAGQATRTEGVLCGVAREGLGHAGSWEGWTGLVKAGRGDHETVHGRS